MTNNNYNVDDVLHELGERAKELNCIYKIEEILKDFTSPLEDIFMRIVKVIPPGWQFVDICKARIMYEDREYPSNFTETKYSQHAHIIVDNKEVGRVEVFYLEPILNKDECPFLVEEQKLLDNIAGRLGTYLFHRHLKETFEMWQKASEIYQNLKKHEQKIFKILENTDVDSILTYLKSPDTTVSSPEELELALEPHSENHWKWRMSMVKSIAKKLDPEKFGVKALYLCGSTKNANAGPKSDIDIIVHFEGTDEQKILLKNWFEGWSLCLSEINYLKTGYETEGLIDLHIITDEDIQKKDSYATMISGIHNTARKIPLMKQSRKNS